MIYLPGFYADGIGGVVRHGEAEFSTSSIIIVARVIRGDGLGILGEDLDPVKSVRFFNFFNNLFPLSGELIHLYDGVKTPVSNKKGIFVDNKRERMSNETR